VCAGGVWRRHCGVRGMRFGCVMGRKTGRKVERAIVGGGLGAMERWCRGDGAGDFGMRFEILVDAKELVRRGSDVNAVSIDEKRIDDRFLFVCTCTFWCELELCSIHLESVKIRPLSTKPPMWLLLRQKRLV